MLQLLLRNYNTSPFFLMYLDAEDGVNIHTVASKFCWLITCKFNTLILIPWKTFSEMFPLQQLLIWLQKMKPKETEDLANLCHGDCMEVYWHGDWTSHPWLLYHGTSSHSSLGCRCAKAHRELPEGQTRGWFKRRSSSPLPWEFCPSEHFKADTFPPASFKSIPVSCHTVLVSLAQLHRKTFLVTSFISPPPPPPPSSSASDEFSGSSALDQPSFSSDASREWDGLAQPWGRNSPLLTLQQWATDWEKLLCTEKLVSDQHKQEKTWHREVITVTGWNSLLAKVGLLPSE